MAPNVQDRASDTHYYYHDVRDSTNHRSSED